MKAMKAKVGEEEAAELPEEAAPAPGQLRLLAAREQLRLLAAAPSSLPAMVSGMLPQRPGKI